MFSAPSYVKLSKKEKVLLTGREKFLIFTLATGMFAISSLGLSSIRLILWMSMMLFAFIMTNKSPKFYSLTVVYILYLTWLVFELVMAPDITYGVRVFLKYLYPLVTLLFAATFVRSKDFIFVAIRWMLISAFLSSFFLGGFMTDILHVWIFYLGGVFWPNSTLADHLAIMSAVSFVMWWRTKEKKYLLLIAWFILSALINSTRTGILSIGIMLMAWTYLRFKLAALPFMITGLLLGVAMILFIPSIKEKMFFAPEKVKSISDITSSYDKNNFNTNARAPMWTVLLNRFYINNRWTGSGLGSVQHYMYTNFVFGGLKVPHNDYIQMMCDSGKVGLWLYLLFPFITYLHLKAYVHKVPKKPIQISAVLAILSFAAILPAMGLDNVVNYAFAVHSYPFIFIGIFLAYKRQEKKRHINV
jgi:hypothetical protein